MGEKAETCSGGSMMPRACAETLAAIEGRLGGIEQAAAQQCAAHEKITGYVDRLFEDRAAVRMQLQRLADGQDALRAGVERLAEARRTWGNRAWTIGKDMCLMAVGALLAWIGHKWRGL